MILRRLTVGLLLAGATVVTTAAPAFAHAELIGSNPAKGASLPAAPTQIQLTFNEPVTPESITVTGPGGAQWTVGQVTVAGAVVTAPVQATGPAGSYTLTYRIRSGDGDPVSGTVDFAIAVATSPTTTTTTTVGTTTPPPSPSPAAQPASSDDGGMPAWVWVLIAVVVLALLAGGFVLARRRHGTTAS